MPHFLIWFFAGAGLVCAGLQPAAFAGKGLVASSTSEDPVGAVSRAMMLRAKVEFIFDPSFEPRFDPAFESKARGKWRKHLVNIDRVNIDRVNVEQVSSSLGSESRLQVKTYPKYIVEHQDASSESNSLKVLQSTMPQMMEVFGTELEVSEHLKSLGFSDEQIRAAPGHFANKRRVKFQSQQDEIRTLVDSGPVDNRIDLVFMGDGYTESDREKFFADMDRLTNDLFSSQTFSSYLPLFNVHAVFRASQKSGIGIGSPSDTAYGLYREGNTLRAIFPSNEVALRDSCGQAPDCDYPVVIANDDYYGGLGGEFAISTRSVTSGTIVLRHELGHNFGKVGEEYDGGGYFGNNYSPSVRKLGWKKWVDGDVSKVKGAEQVALALGWPWKNISSEPYQQKFKSNGKFDFAKVRLSLSGLAGPGAFAVKLNGNTLEDRVIPTEDRTFIDFLLAEPLAEGEHTLEVEAFNTQGNEYLSSMTIHEYAEDPRRSPETIGAFPVFDANRNVVGFRPTDEACLMRNMLHPWFCMVCQENNWRQLLGALKLHDGYAVKIAEEFAEINLTTLGLGQFRSKGAARLTGEQLKILWFVNGAEFEEGRDKNVVRILNAVKGDRIQVKLLFESAEFRNDDQGFSKDTLNFAL